jgi:hypothetical protein
MCSSQHCLLVDGMYTFIPELVLSRTALSCRYSKFTLYLIHIAPFRK